MAAAGFAPTASVYLDVTPTSGNILIPTTGSPVTMLLVNTSQDIPLYFAIGTSNAVTAVLNSSIALNPRQSIYVTIGANTYIAAVCFEASVGLSITVGT